MGPAPGSRPGALTRRPNMPQSGRWEAELPITCADRTDPAVVEMLRSPTAGASATRFCASADFRGVPMETWPLRLRKAQLLDLIDRGDSGFDRPRPMFFTGG